MLADGADRRTRRAKRRSGRCARSGQLRNPAPDLDAAKALTEFTRLINRTLHQDSLSRFGDAGIDHHAFRGGNRGRPALRTECGRFARLPGARGRLLAFF